MTNLSLKSCMADVLFINKNQIQLPIERKYIDKFIDLYCGRPLDTSGLDGTYHFYLDIADRLERAKQKINWRSYDTVTFQKKGVCSKIAIKSIDLNTSNFILNLDVTKIIA